MAKNYEYMDETGCRNLCNAVVILAARDYRVALKALKKNPHNYKALADKDELERFFMGDVYKIYTDVDGEFLMKKLQEEVFG